MTAPDTVTLLGEHVLFEGREWICGAIDCDWSLPYNSFTKQPNDEHRAHVAAVLDAAKADEIRAAAEKAFSEGREAGATFEQARWVGAGVIGVPRPEVAVANPYRTDKETDE